MKEPENKKSYYFFIGTDAELIKLIPVLSYFNDHNIKFKLIASGQNNIDSNKNVLEIANINSVNLVLNAKPPKQTTPGLLIWFFKTFFIGLLKLRKEFKNIDKEGAYVIVLGDTVSTVMGAFIGFLSGIKVAHIEAGFRSFDFLQPFPEEIDRFLVSLVASVHFCPYESLIKNIEKRKGIKINTHYNTSVDSFNMAVNRDVNTGLTNKLKTEKFFIFMMHRQENLLNEPFVRKAIQRINDCDNIKCLFIMHEPTRVVLKKYGLISTLENNKNIILSGRIDFFEFIKILKMSEFLMTDGGGNQQECFYLGKPCLLLRKVHEGKEGIGRNMILAGDDIDKINNFMENYKRYIKDPVLPSVSPSRIIARYLIEN